MTISTFLAINTAISQSKSEVLSSIDSITSQIDTRKGLEEFKLTDKEFLDKVSDSEGTLIGYFINQNLVKIYSQMLTFSGFIDITYYYQNSRLICAKHIERKLVGKYEEGDWIAWDFSIPPDTAFIGIYYFQGDQLLETNLQDEPYFTDPFNLEQFLFTSNNQLEILNDKAQKE